MTSPALSPATMRIVDWLGEVGPRWGLPEDGCRVHALLYLAARAMPADVIATTLSLDRSRAEAALAWLAEERLAQSTTTGWTTQSDPWALMTQALDRRRARELAPAREVMQAWRHDHTGDDPEVVRQATRLFGLIEDIAAIDAGTRRLSPDAMRLMVGVGGRAARFIDRAFGGRRS